MRHVSTGIRNRPLRAHWEFFAQEIIQQDLQNDYKNKKLNAHKEFFYWADDIIANSTYLGLEAALKDELNPKQASRHKLPIAYLINVGYLTADAMPVPIKPTIESKLENLLATAPSNSQDQLRAYCNKLVADKKPARTILAYSRAALKYEQFIINNESSWYTSKAYEKFAMTSRGYASSCSPYLTFLAKRTGKIRPNYVEPSCKKVRLEKSAQISLAVSYWKKTIRAENPKARDLRTAAFCLLVLVYSLRPIKASQLSIHDLSETTDNRYQVQIGGTQMPLDETTSKALRRYLGSRPLAFRTKYIFAGQNGLKPMHPTSINYYLSQYELTLIDLYVASNEVDVHSPNKSVF